MAANPVKTWSTPVRVEEKRPIPCALCGTQALRPALNCEGFSYSRCVYCGLVQMNPQPFPEEIWARYNAATENGPCPGNCDSSNYLDYELANEEAFLKLQILALTDAGFWELKTGKQGKVLDIGCATGSLLTLLREQGWETAGVEISRPQAEYGINKRGLQIHCRPLEDIKFPGNYFDAVLASHLIEHLNDPRGFVKEACRILSPEGRFYVTTPNIAGFQARLFRGRWRSAIFDHLYLFSEKTLGRMLKENGFEIEKTATWGGLAAGIAPNPIKRIFDRAAKRFGFGDVMIMRARKT